MTATDNPVDSFPSRQTDGRSWNPTFYYYINFFWLFIYFTLCFNFYFPGRSSGVNQKRESHKSGAGDDEPQMWERNWVGQKHRMDSHQRTSIYNGYYQGRWVRPNSHAEKTQLIVILILRSCSADVGLSACRWMNVMDEYPAWSVPYLTVPYHTHYPILVLAYIRETVLTAAIPSGRFPRPWCICMYVCLSVIDIHTVAGGYIHQWVNPFEL